MIVARLPCLPLWWRYHLRPALRHARRGMRRRTLLLGVVPLLLFVWLGYGGYFVAVQQGQVAVPLLALRLSLLGSFAVGFVLSTRHRRSAVLFYATTPTELTPSLRLQALANLGLPAGYAVLVAAVVMPWLFVGLSALVLWFMYRGASDRYLATVADEWLEPDDSV